MRLFLVCLAAGIVAALVSAFPGAAFQGNCTYFVGTGNCGGTQSQGTITSAPKGTSGFALRDNVRASAGANMPANGRLIVYYQRQSDGTFVYKLCNFGVSYCYWGMDSPWPAKALCNISAPPPPRSVTGYCRTDW